MGAMNTRLLGEYFDGITSNSPMKADDGYGHHRVLDVDPRSPTSEINRTPIRVDTTPISQSLSDPRSPTQGISRTPLYQEITEPDFSVQPCDGSYLELDLDQKDSANDSTDLDLSNPSTGASSSSASSPGIFSTSDDLDVLNKSDDEDELQRSLSDPELSTDQICLLDRRQSDSGVDFNMKSLHRSLRKKCSKAKQLVAKISPTKSKSTSTPSDIHHQTKPRRSLGDITAIRSPLANRNVDVNSPLAIVQRKQASKLNAFRRHSTPDGRSASTKKYNVVSLNDKENLPFDC